LRATLGPRKPDRDRRDRGVQRPRK
jgi:hypothetical protein